MVLVAGYLRCSCITSVFFSISPIAAARDSLRTRAVIMLVLLFLLSAARPASHESGSVGVAFLALRAAFGKPFVPFVLAVGPLLIVYETRG